MSKILSSIITGGANGIGRAIADSVLSRGARIDVNLSLHLVVDIDDKGFEIEKKLKETHGDDRVMFIRCDVTDSNSLRDAFIKTYDTFDGINLLINSAGITTVKEENWRKTLDINLISLVECCYLGKEFMNKSSSNAMLNHIVNIASAGGLTGMAVDPVYSASKHGVVGLSRSLAERWAPLKIRINCLCPMLVDTSLLVNAAKFNEGYCQQIKGVTLLKTSDVVRVFDNLVEERSTTGEVLHISTKGTKRMNKKIININN